MRGMERKYQICFVCSGNACRSPFAECVMRALLSRAGLMDIEVSSAGTIEWGRNPRDPMMTRIAKEMGYELTGETTCVTRESLWEADSIVVFSRHHRDAVTRVLDYAHWNRIILFSQLAFGTDEEIEDPNYQTEAVYRRVASRIEDGCRRLVDCWRRCPPPIR